MRTLFIASSIVIASAFLTACEEEPATVGPADSGTPTPARDAGSDAGAKPDGGAGMDAGSDGGIDSGTDSGTDAGDEPDAA